MTIRKNYMMLLETLLMNNFDKKQLTADKSLLQAVRTVRHRNVRFFIYFACGTGLRF
jgi:hypothetical protein